MGARIDVILSDESKEKDHTLFYFEVSVAEIICRKDSAEILELTIKMSS